MVARSGLWAGLHPGMALASKGMVLAFVVFTVLNVDVANAVYSAVRRWIEATLSWYYILAICVTLFACLYIMLSRHGKVRLGDDDSRPEFSTFSWLAMLFSAGLGIGLLFYSIYEPLFYFDTAQSDGHPNNPHADHAGAVGLDERRAGPRHARHLFPLGLSRLGGLRSGRPVSGLLRLPQETAADAALGAVSPHWRPYLRPGRPRRGSARRVRSGCSASPHRWAWVQPKWPLA